MNLKGVAVHVAIAADALDGFLINAGALDIARADEGRIVFRAILAIRAGTRLDDGFSRGLVHAGNQLQRVGVGGVDIDFAIGKGRENVL